MISILLEENLLFDNDTLFWITIVILPFSLAILAFIIPYGAKNIEIIKSGFKQIYQKDVGKITIDSKNITKEIIEKLKEFLEAPNKAKKYLDENMDNLRSRYNRIKVSLLLLMIASFFLMFIVKFDLRIYSIKLSEVTILLNVFIIFIILTFIYTIILLWREINKLFRLEIK